ncbi:MAG: serine hydrolase [Mizugakiibacter sp.]|uniref:serine hydrolase domain-containing protein n=1 Tax=Mizugakiibacter sp. TaxID=1972610 RepID=UPI0031BF4B1B|nr:beta-lactamase family protein [Xanthomonadaceae bacterium]
MRFLRSGLALAFALLAAPAGAADYVPSRQHWERREPAAAGFDPRRLAEAVAYAQAHADVQPADMRQVLLDHYGPREPGYRVHGPTKPRVGAAGVVVRHGYIVAQWGDVARADMTFSVAKSYLSSVAGLALADGLIGSLDDRLADTVDDGSYASPHNAPITWRHMLTQTSDWQGTLWGIPDWADRPEGADRARWPQRTLYAPGTRFKYNDVRINALAYALLQVWRKPLPQVLKERVMDPIGASATWRWTGYDDSWVDLDGLRMQSVSGGGHFGGGMFVSALDHARYGLLFLRGGRWGERQVLPADWIPQVQRPSPAKDDYGLLWWLNTGRKAVPAAPGSAYWAAGFGGHYIYVDGAHDLVVVLRWDKDFPGTIARILGALQAAPER